MSMQEEQISDLCERVGLYDSDKRMQELIAPLVESGALLAEVLASYVEAWSQLERRGNEVILERCIPELGQFEFWIRNPTLQKAELGVFRFVETTDELPSAGDLRAMADAIRSEVAS